MAGASTNPVRPFRTPTSPLKPRNRETAKPRNRETAKPRNRETAKPRNRETAKPRNRETAKPRNRETAKPRNRRSANRRLNQAVLAVGRLAVRGFAVRGLAVCGLRFAVSRVLYARSVPRNRSNPPNRFEVSHLEWEGEPRRPTCVCMKSTPRARSQKTKARMSVFAGV